MRVPVLLSAALLLLLGPAGLRGQRPGSGSVPPGDLMPLDAAYSHALRLYAEHDWAESVRFLELSLRLHRLLRDGEAACGRGCGSAGRDGDGDGDRDGDGVLRVARHVLLRAACLKKCKADFPVFQLEYPPRDLLDTFQQRVPYRYLQYAYYQLKELEKAVAAAHTFLQKNPAEPHLTKNMEFYQSLLDLDRYLIDLEEQPYESVFVKSVTLYNSGDFSNSARLMEQAVSRYLEAHALCVAGCQGAYPTVQVQDFYPTLAGLCGEALRCQVACEEQLTPSVGGFFVHKLVATMYHYLQFSYYKLNDAKSAAPCAASYILFDPEDQVMQQNVAYYRFYREQWGLEDLDFQPRAEALRYFNQTTRQRDLLDFARNYLQTDDQAAVGPEEFSSGSSHPDAEFEGEGDYEESFLSQWWQEARSKWDTGEVDS